LVLSTRLFLGYVIDWRKQFRSTGRLTTRSNSLHVPNTDGVRCLTVGNTGHYSANAATTPPTNVISSKCTSEGARCRTSEGACCRT
jgi:hypothetical protein